MSALTYHKSLAVPALVCILGLAGCSVASPRSDARSHTPSARTSTAVLSTPPGSTGRCGPPKVATAQSVRLQGPGGSSMPGFVLGRGKTVAILLHQTNGGALCGWWPYAAWLTGTYPARALLFDLCGYGQATCPAPTFSADQVAQVATAVRWARAHGAQRVVLVGASMGGAVALNAAGPTHADAIVDLSGPPNWRGVQASAVTPLITAPTLIASSPDDPSTNYTDLHRAYAAIAAPTKQFVTGNGAHGWDLLADSTTTTPRWLPLATRVARWIMGQY